MPADFAVGPSKKRAPRKKTPAKSALPAPGPRDLVKQTESQAARKVQQAAESVPGGVRKAVKRYPTVKHYTKAQRKEVVSGQKEAILDYVSKGATSAEKAQRNLEVQAAAKSGDRETRRQLGKLIGATHTQTRNTDVAAGRRILKERYPGQQLSKIAPTRENLEQLGKEARKPTNEDYSGEQKRTDAAARKETEKNKLPGPKDLLNMGAFITNPTKGLESAKEALSTTGRILDQTTRPLHAIAGATRAYQQGGSLKDIEHAAVKGIRNQEKTTFGDIFRDHGFSPAASAVLGGASDMLVDPTSYVAFGLKAPATALREAAEVASNAASGARVAGDLAKAEKLAKRARELEVAAAKAPTNRGIQVGISTGRSRHMTSGTGSANLSKLLKVPQGATKVRNTRIVEGVAEAVNPNFRPRGVSMEDWANTRNALRRQRAGERQATRTENNVQAELRSGEKQAKKAGVQRRDIFRAVERTPKDTEAAAQIRHLTGVGIGDTGAAAARAQREVPAYQEAQFAINQRLADGKDAVKEAQAARAAAQQTYEKALRQLDPETPAAAAEKLLAPARAAVTEAARVETAATKALAKTRTEVKAAHQALEARRGDLAEQSAAARISELPAAGPSELPEIGRRVTQRVEQHLADIAREGRLNGTLPTTRTNYMPHVWPEKLETGARGRVKGGTRDRVLDAGKSRQLQGSAEEINQELVRQGREPLFEDEDFASVVANRIGKAKRASVAKETQDELVLTEVAKPVRDLDEFLTRNAALPEEQMRRLYVIDNKGIRELVDHHGRPDVSAARKLADSGEVFDMHPSVASLWTKIDTPAKTEKLFRGFDKVQGAMKTVFTVFNAPAYQMRNYSGALFQAYAGDTKMRDFVDAARLMGYDVKANKAARKFGKEYNPQAWVNLGHGRKMRAQEFLDRLMKEGGSHTGFMQIEGGMEEGTRLARATDVLRSVDGFLDNHARTAMVLGGLRRGWSWDRAVKHSLDHLIDYGDMTNAERSFFKRVMPFWMFASRNTQAQLRQILSRPGKYSTYQKIREEGAGQAGLPDDWESRQAPYQQRGGGIPMKIGGVQKVLYPGSPLTDLGRLGALTDPKAEFDQTLAMVTPFLKAPLEFGTNNNFFFRQPIYRDNENPNAKKWVAAPGFLKNAPGPLKKLLGVTEVIDTKTGKPTTMWSAKADYALRQTPQGNFAIQTATPTQGSHGNDAGDAWFGRLTGINRGPYDKQKNKINHLYDRLDEITVEQKNMNERASGPDRGYVKPTNRKSRHTPAYNALSDEKARVQEKLDNILSGKGYPAKRQTPSRKKKSGGTYGGGSGAGAAYGSGGGGKMYGG